jgi:hypothetical protein
MKTLIQLILFTSLLLLLQAVSCKRPDDKKLDCNNNTMQLPQMAKDYFLFKDGSYWLYKNTITQEKDSFYVIDFRDFTGNNNIFKYGNNLNKCYEGYDYKLFSIKFKRLDIGIGPLEPDNNTPFKNQTFFLTQTSFQKITFIGDSLLRSDFVLGSTINLLDSLGVSGKFYYNIISQTNTNLGIDYAKVSYYAKNIGLIKFTTNDNQTYELIKYHINQ